VSDELDKYYVGDTQDSFSFITIAKVGGYACCECGEYIGSGDEFEIYTTVDEGEWLAYCTCLGCKKIRTSLSKYSKPTELWEDVEDFYGFYEEKV
jgi:hypothetical protein